MTSRFFGMNRAGYFLLFFDFLIFLAFLTGLHPQDLHIMPTSFRGKDDQFFFMIERLPGYVNQIVA